MRELGRTRTRQEELKTDWTEFEQVKNEIRNEALQGRKKRQQSMGNTLQQCRFTAENGQFEDIQIGQGRNYLEIPQEQNLSTQSALHNTISAQPPGVINNSAHSASLYNNQNNIATGLSAISTGLQSHNAMVQKEQRNAFKPMAITTTIGRGRARRVEFTDSIQTDLTMGHQPIPVNMHYNTMQNSSVGGPTQNLVSTQNSTQERHNVDPSSLLETNPGMPQNRATMRRSNENQNHETQKISRDNFIVDPHNELHDFISQDNKTPIDHNQFWAETNTLAEQRGYLIENPYTANLQEQGLWRNPMNVDGYTNANSINNNGMFMDRSRSRERRTPPYPVRRRDQNPGNRYRHYSGEYKSPDKIKNKSGINDTADTFAKEKLIWPQKQLGFRFLHQQPSFEQLQFEHLVVGELSTIAGCEDELELKNRIRLLQRVAYWKMKGAQWYQIRSFYAAIISGIEAHELHWDDNYTEIEAMLIDRPQTRDGVKFDRKPGKQFTKNKEDNIWFCKKFNSETGCNLESGHLVTTPRGEQKPAMHICARCLRMKKGRKDHSEQSCPEKQ